MWAQRPLLSKATVTGPSPPQGVATLRWMKKPKKYSTSDPHGLGINGRALAKPGLGVLNRRPVGGVAVASAWLPSFGM